MLKNYQQQSPIKTNRQKETFAYVCFRCNKPGHFIKDCPENTPKRSPISQPSASTTSDPEFPSTYCRCGAGLCEILVSGSCNNPGRKYYRCPGKYDKNCGYFKWCDKLGENEIRKAQPELNFPTCGCGAGICSVRVAESRPNAGRRYFACPIKKGDGACNFRQWLDDSHHSALVTPEDAASEQNILLDELDLSYEEAMQIDGLEIVAHELPSEQVQVQIEVWEGSKATDKAEEAVQIDASELGVRDLPLEQVQVQTEGNDRDKTTDRADEPSTEIHPQPVQNNASLTSLDSELTTQNTMDDDSAFENTQASVTTVVATLHDPRDPLVDMLLHFLKAYLFQEPSTPGQVADAPQRVTISAMSPVISGKSSCAFPPKAKRKRIGRIQSKDLRTISALKPSPSSLFPPFSLKFVLILKGTFPNFDHIYMSKDNVSAAPVILEDLSEEGFENSSSLDEQPLSGLLLNPSDILKDGLNEGSSMSGTIRWEFGKVAHHIQNKLIMLLESKDPQDYKVMLKEADCTFAALDHLQVNYVLFRTRVTEYINQATALARIEQAIDEDTSSEELLKCYNIEKSHFDNVRDAYCHANDAYIASSKKESSLRKNASYLKGLLVEVERELACCEEDNAKHQESLDRISRTMSECKDRLQTACREATEALKRQEKRETERSAAKAAFEKARAQLRK